MNLYQFVFRSNITNAQALSIVSQESEIEACVIETADEITSAERIYATPITIWASNAAFPSYSEEKMEIV